MRFRFLLGFLSAAIFVAVALPCSSQAAPAAKGGGLPLVVGAGFSNYNVDFCCDHREDGGTAWADWNLQWLPRRLQGLGIEAEVRDLSFATPVVNMRYDTAAGGAVYHMLRFGRIRPYAKGMEGFGSIDFPSTTTYSHDTRTFFAMGGGADFHLTGQFWLRADYEYQMWWGLFGRGHALTPNGVTVGPEFDFGGRGSR